MLFNSVTASDMKDAHIFFNHIPKTGGTSLIALFKQAFGEDKCFRHRARSAKTGLIGPALEGLPDEELIKLRFIAGHFSYSAANRLRSLGRKVFHVTVIRDPVDRLVSDYYFNRERGRPDLKAKASALSLEQYTLEKLGDPNSKLVHNGQCWFVADERSYAAARDAIDQKFLLACTVAQLDQMQAKLAALLDLPFEAPKRVNETVEKKAPDISPEVEARLRHSCDGDTKLLAFVRTQFELC